MSYASSYGVHEVLDGLAKWVSWAEYAAASRFREAGDEGEQNTRYNLRQFWESAGVFSGSADATIKEGVQKLDSFAHGILARLEEQLAILAPKDSQERADHAKLATLYQQRAIMHAEAAKAYRLKSSQLAQLKTVSKVNEWANASVPDDRFGASLLDVFKKNWLGVPVWAWGAGVIVATVLITSRR